MPTKHDDCSTAPGNFLIARSDSTGSWSVVCKTCATRWIRGQEDIPDHVKSAVAVAVGMTTVTEEEAVSSGGQVLKVGDRVYSTPKEPTCEWLLTPGVILCTLLAPPLSAAEEEAFHRERVEFALTSGDHALCLSIRMGRELDWGDGFWQEANQRDHFEPGVTDPGDSSHLGVVLRLVDAHSGVLLGMRFVTWPTRFSKAVHKAVQTQIAHRSHREAGQHEIQTWLARYPTPRALATQRAEITCRGGAGR